MRHPPHSLVLSSACDRNDGWRCGTAIITIKNHIGSAVPSRATRSRSSIASEGRPQRCQQTCRATLCQTCATTATSFMPRGRLGECLTQVRIDADGTNSCRNTYTCPRSGFAVVGCPASFLAPRRNLNHRGSSYWGPPLLLQSKDSDITSIISTYT